MSHTLLIQTFRSVGAANNCVLSKAPFYCFSSVILILSVGKRIVLRLKKNTNNNISSFGLDVFLPTGVKKVPPSVHSRTCGLQFFPTISWSTITEKLQQQRGWGDSDTLQEGRMWAPWAGLLLYYYGYIKRTNGSSIKWVSPWSRLIRDFRK